MKVKGETFMPEKLLTMPQVPRRARILIADDETSMRELIDRFLQLAGYTTVRAVDGQDALEMAECLAPFDLLLTDEVMPRMMGHELAQELHRRQPNLKVLYLTGFRDRLVNERMNGLSEYEAVLDKPSTADSLLAAVSALLSGGRPRS